MSVEILAPQNSPRAIALWRFCDIMTLEDSGDDQLSR